MSTQGTAYFMSSKVREALGDGNIYLQSPVDDLESFFHVFVWAILHNELSQEAFTVQERKYKDMLYGNLGDRLYAQTSLQSMESPSAIITQLQDVVDAWSNLQAKLRKKYRQIEGLYRRIAAKGQSGITEQAFRRWAWNLIAFEGVQRILDVIYKHRERLRKCPEFSQDGHAQV